jgi:hypothetical protein
MINVGQLEEQKISKFTRKLMMIRIGLRGFEKIG